MQQRQQKGEGKENTEIIITLMESRSSLDSNDESKVLSKIRAENGCFLTTNQNVLF